MNIKFKKLAAFLMLLSIGFSVVACSSGTSQQNKYINEKNSLQDSMGSDTAKEEKYNNVDGSVGNKDDKTTQTGNQVSSNRMLEKIVTLEVETKEFEKDKSSLEELTSQFGGYFSSSESSTQVYRDVERRYAQLRIKIPVEKTDDFLAAIKGNVGSIKSENSSALDHTDSYFDNETRIKNTEKHLEALRKLYETATDLEDIIVIQREISTVEADLESLKQNKTDIERRVQYSTFNINLKEVIEYTEAKDVRKMNLGQKIKETFWISYNNFILVLENILLILVYLWPLLLIGAIVTAILVSVHKSNKAKGKNKPKNNMQMPMNNTLQRPMGLQGPMGSQAPMGTQGPMGPQTPMGTGSINSVPAQMNQDITTEKQDTKNEHIDNNQTEMKNTDNSSNND